MTIRRCAVAVGAVALGLFTLSACSKPTPLATVAVGKGSVHTEASCYDDGKQLSQTDLQSCLRKDGGKTVKVRQTDAFHVGTDPAIADKGWFLVVNGQQKTDVIKDTYRTFAGSQMFVDSSTGQTSKTATMDLLETTGSSANTVIGVWQFKLELAN
jgi:hypothetical protein